MFVFMQVWKVLQIMRVQADSTSDFKNREQIITVA